MPRRVFFGLVLLACLPALPFAGAVEKGSECRVTFSPTLVMIDADNGGTYYLVVDLLEDAYPVVTYLVQETNGLPGLQRDDPVRKDETCGAPPDASWR